MIAEEKLKQFESRRKDAVEALDGQGDAGLYSAIVEHDVPELIAAIRELQKPLAERLEPTIDLLYQCRNSIQRKGDSLLPEACDEELTRLRTLTGREK